MRDVKILYEKRLQAYQRLGSRQKQAISRLSNLRLLVFAAGIAAVGILYYFKLPIIMAAVLIAWIAFFAYLVVKHHRLIENKKYADALQAINSQSLQRLQGEWKKFSDTGEEFRNENHPYTGDLDIFGRGSLFQQINTSCTYTGRQKLAQILETIPASVKLIYSRQEAIRELAPKLGWRQHFMAEGLVIINKMSNLEDLYQWAGKVNQFYRSNRVVALFRILPAATILLGLLYMTTGVVPWYIPVAGLVLQFLLLKYKAKERGVEFLTAEKYKNALKIYDKLLKAFEEKSFHAEHLVQLQSRLQDKEGKTAFKQVNKLVKLWESISNRYNAFHIFFNILTLWDYQCMIALEAWKDRSGKEVKRWFDTIGEVEALCSLAVIGHDHPDWAVPEVAAEDAAQVRATAMGHPLLGEKRVCNDLEVIKPHDILLITGSNMSGKSTLLRTVGINLILAYAGAPACASVFRCSILEIYTCMRTSDNLEQNISSFYAELLRIKMILHAAKEGRQVFFLLDEIFKGTNSRDRHTGAKVLIRELSRQGAVGLVSTHDLELSELEKESGGSIKNYHFREYYQDNQIQFDYKLRPGVSETRNAIYLMRMAGIQIEE